MTYTKHHSAPSPAQVARMKQALAAGVTLKDLAKRFKLSPATIQKLVNELRKA